MIGGAIEPEDYPIFREMRSCGIPRGYEADQSSELFDKFFVCTHANSILAVDFLAAVSANG